MTREDMVDRAVRRTGVLNVLRAAWHFNPEGCRKMGLPMMPDNRLYTHNVNIEVISTVRRFYHVFKQHGGETATAILDAKKLAEREDRRQAADVGIC